MTSPVNSSGAMISTFMMGCSSWGWAWLKALFHRGHGRDAEGHLRGLAFLDGGVGQGHGDVHRRVAVNRPAFQGLLRPPGRSWARSPGPDAPSGSSDDEGVAGAPGPGGQRLRLHFGEMVLAGQFPVEAAGLLDRGGDGLPVDHLGAAGPDVGVELPLQAVHDHLQVQFPHAGEQGLAGVFVGV